MSKHTTRLNIRLTDADKRLLRNAKTLREIPLALQVCLPSDMKKRLLAAEHREGDEKREAAMRRAVAVSVCVPRTPKSLAGQLPLF